MIPTNIPPEVNRPVQVVTVKSQVLKVIKISLRHDLKIYKHFCEIGRKALIPSADMIHRVLFLDVLNTENCEQLFDFDVMKGFFPPVETFPPVPTQLPNGNAKLCVQYNVSINEYFRMCDIRTHVKPFNRFFGRLKVMTLLGPVVAFSFNWREDDRFNRLPCYMRELILALRNQSFPEPKFVNSLCVPQDIPIRLETGEPNLQFFNQWYDNCVSYVDGE